MRRRLSLIAWTVIICIALSACSETAGSSQNTEVGEIQVYRLVREEYRRSGEELVRPETVRLENDADPLHAMLVCLAWRPGDDELESPLPAGAEILSYSLSGGEIILNMGAGYLELSGMDRTVADYCITLTLCQLAEVDAVSIYVEGEAVSQGLTSDDVILYDMETNPFEKQLKLYFADAGGEFIAPEYHSITVSRETSIERVVMEELLRGPYDKELRAAIPEGTRLISIAIQGGVCTVDLSREFYDNRPETAMEERLAIYSIVDSLTSLASVNSVLILIEGQAYEKYVYRSLAEPLSRNEAAIGPARSGVGDAELDLMYAADDNDFIAVPTVIARDEVISLEQSAVESLMTLEQEPCFETVFTPEDAVISAETQNGVCTVILNKEFFASRREPGEAEKAVWLIVATLQQLEGVNGVRIICEDSGILFAGELSLKALLQLPDDINIIY